MSVISEIVGLGLAAIAAMGSGRLALRRFDERRNIRVLEERYACTHEQAERLYRLARRDGFGSAYRAVFGSEVRAATTGRSRGSQVEGSAGDPRPL